MMTQPVQCGGLYEAVIVLAFAQQYGQGLFSAGSAEFLQVLAILRDIGWRFQWLRLFVGFGADSPESTFVV